MYTNITQKKNSDDSGDLKGFMLNKNSSLNQVQITPTVVNHISNLTQIKSDGETQFILDGSRIGASQMKQIDLFNDNVA